MAGTVTITEKFAKYLPVKKVRITWTSNAAGIANGITTEYYDGRICAVLAKPGTNTPSANYDVTLKDDDGDDVLLEAGQNLAAESVGLDESVLGCVSESKLHFGVVNAGSNKDGIFSVWIS